MKKEKRKEYLIYAGVLILGVSLYISSGTASEEIKSKTLDSVPPGKASQEYIFDVKVGDDFYEDIELRVQPRDYSEEELEDLLEECLPNAKSLLLNGNESFERVEDDLMFFEKMEGYPFSFEWKCDDSLCIGASGELMTADPFDTYIYMTAYCKSFSRDFGIPIHAVPGEKIKTAKKREILSSYLKNQLQNNAMENAKESEKTEIKLPDSMDGKIITYFISGDERNPIYLAVTLGICIVLWYGFKLDRDKKIKERMEKIREEFPGMLRQMTMYLSAGMTVRNIWFFLCEETEKRGKPTGPLFEEMEITVNELKSGASEVGAYTDFGKRTAIPETVRFAALLAQNIKTGGSRLSDLLREETQKTLTEQKQRALKAGEEAGTKLLFPMMLLLGDMMAIIMVPAFMTII